MLPIPINFKDLTRKNRYFPLLTISSESKMQFKCKCLTRRIELNSKLKSRHLHGNAKMNRKLMRPASRLQRFTQEAGSRLRRQPELFIYLLASQRTIFAPHFSPNRFFFVLFSILQRMNFPPTLTFLGRLVVAATAFTILG